MNPVGTAAGLLFLGTRVTPNKNKYSNLTLTRFAVLLIWLLSSAVAHAQDVPDMHLSTFAAGSGPAYADGVLRLLDGDGTPGQSNAVAFDQEREGAFERLQLRCRLRVLAGGDGGALVFLNTAEYGRRGPAPFVKSWVEPNLAGTFAVGIDVHNPPNQKQGGSRDNYQGLPQREVSLHWDGREIVKRVAPAEFRGDFTDCEILVRHVIGGAEVTLSLAGGTVYDRYFMAGMRPYPARLALGAGTRNDTSTEFDVRNLVFTTGEPARPRRAPNHVEIFNHVLTGGGVNAYEKEVTLPSLAWAYGRVILTLELHDAGPDWDEWDRNGSLSVVDPDGVKRDIVPFITSFRTPGYWQVDVTHFRPWLAGAATFEIATTTDRDTNRGYMLSASLDFYHGTPDLEPYRIVPLWDGTAQYRSDENHFRDFFTPRSFSSDASTQAARLFITTTGHSQVGEFVPSRRTLVFAPVKDGDPATEVRFENVLWKSDCYLNPNRPQFGTWQYARAGWAPGDVVRPWWIDLTPHLDPGQTAELRYEPEPYDFSGVPEDRRPTADQIDRARQLVRAYLILYRSAAQLIPLPPLQVIDVEAGSNAARSGLLAGDYLESYGYTRPQTIDALRAAIRAASAAVKQQIKVVIYRDDERLVMTLEPGRMGVNLAEF